MDAENAQAVAIDGGAGTSPGGRTRWSVCEYCAIPEARIRFLPIIEKKEPQTAYATESGRVEMK